MDERDDKIAQGLVRIAEILERISQQQDNNTRTLVQIHEDNTFKLAQILDRIDERTARTEQMTARILAEVAQPGQAH